jgi:hypothetical protein
MPSYFHLMNKQTKRQPTPNDQVDQKPRSGLHQPPFRSFSLRILLISICATLRIAALSFGLFQVSNPQTPRGPWCIHTQLIIINPSHNKAGARSHVNTTVNTQTCRRKIIGASTARSQQNWVARALAAPRTFDPALHYPSWHDANTGARTGWWPRARGSSASLVVLQSICLGGVRMSQRDN